jgi:Zn-dependent oligopeptidase
MTELLSAALLDMNWHGIAEPVDDVDAFEAAALKKEGLDLPAVPRAIAAAISPIFSAAAMRQGITLSVDANAG